MPPLRMMTGWATASAVGEHHAVKMSRGRGSTCFTNASAGDWCHVSRTEPTAGSAPAAAAAGSNVSTDSPTRLTRLRHMLGHSTLNCHDSWALPSPRALCDSTVSVGTARSPKKLASSRRAPSYSSRLLVFQSGVITSTVGRTTCFSIAVSFCQASVRAAPYAAAACTSTLRGGSSVVVATGAPRGA